MAPRANGDAEVFGRRKKRSLTSQSWFLVCSIERSSIDAWPLPSSRVTLRPSISAMTRTSRPRGVNRRRSMRPLVTTWPGLIEVTRLIGTKTRRRPLISTTIPVARGAVDLRYASRTSMTFPTRSPAGSKTPQPASLATNTRVALTQSTLDQRFRFGNP